MASWKLVDAEARHALSPETFDLLPLVERATLDPDDQAKIAFEGAGEVGERFWVTVIRRVARSYLGRVEAELHGPWAVEYYKGTLVAFEPKNVLDVVYADRDG